MYAKFWKVGVIIFFIFFDLRYNLIAPKDPEMTTTRHACCTLAINGLHETLHVFPETLNGLHETLNGLHETFLTRNGLLAFHAVLKRFDFRSNRVLSDNPLMVRVVLKWHGIIKILIFDK